MNENDSQPQDKFAMRYGAKPGRCNAFRKNGQPCHQWPVKGHKRCHRHGGGWTRDGRRSKDHITNLVSKRVLIEKPFSTNKT